MCKLSSATGRERIAQGRWKPTATTRSGGALFGPLKAIQIVADEYFDRTVADRAARAAVIVKQWESVTPC
jgi:hypothetical protein